VNYVLKTEIIGSEPNQTEIVSAYTPQGDYVGDRKRAECLYRLGIAPEKANPYHTSRDVVIVETGNPDTAGAKETMTMTMTMATRLVRLNLADAGREADALAAATAAAAVAAEREAHEAPTSTASAVRAERATAEALAAAVALRAILGIVSRETADAPLTVAAAAAAAGEEVA